MSSKKSESKPSQKSKNSKEVKARRVPSSHTSKKSFSRSHKDDVKKVPELKDIDTKSNLDIRKSKPSGRSVSAAECHSETKHIAL